jgi:superfamily I DNA/RNA helicase
VVLSRPKRDAIWPVFEEYRAQLAIRKLKEFDDAYADVAELLMRERAETTGGNGESRARDLYGAIVVDETQDFGPQALRLIRAMIAPGLNDLFFVGDGHQRIYSRNRAAMSKCGIDIRGRAKKLYLNYRTTDEIRKQAVAVLEGCSIDDLDDGHDETRRYKSLSHGPVPVLTRVASLDEVLPALLETIKVWSAAPSEDTRETICVIAPTKKQRDSISHFMERNATLAKTIDENQNAGAPQECIYVATMHRAKGLEFDRVIVVAPQNWLGDVRDTENHRKLLYVATSRAKKETAIYLY